MTVGTLLVLDLLATLLSAAAWLGSGGTAALGHRRAAMGLLVLAALATAARIGLVVQLDAAGWWFVQEKALLTLPMAVSTTVLAIALAARPLLQTEGRQATGPVVALLTAGYAALAGFVITFLFGYPVTFTSAVSAMALVGFAALLTARASRPPAEPVGPGPTRRAVLTATAGATAVALGGTFLGSRSRPHQLPTWPATPSSGAPYVSIAQLRGATSPAAGGTVNRHTITAQKATTQLASGTSVEAWTFDGTLPGPALTATEGDLIKVTLRNQDIEDGVSLHWHGYDVACGEDGAPPLTQDAVMPGDDFVYHFRAEQVGTYWFHTHSVSAVGVRKGLYGTFVVHPRTSTESAHSLDLTIPVHTLNGMVLVGDRETRTDHAATVGTRVRLRLINTDSDPHRFALAGTPFQVVAVDGRDLHEPGKVSDQALSLPAGGRMDVVFAMPSSSVALVVDGRHDTGVRLLPEGSTADEPTDTDGWPELDLLGYGTPTAIPFDPERPQRRFTLVLDRGLALIDGAPAYAYTVNGRAHPNIPDQIVAEGDVVRFTVVNRTLETHPWHLHGHAVLILSRNGVPSTGSPLWMDTFDVRAGDVWEVAFQSNNRGIWMNHCHNLPHADQGMMMKLAYEGVTSPFETGHGHHA